jgi:predicted flavoprotein YhiN
MLRPTLLLAGALALGAAEPAYDIVVYGDSAAAVAAAVQAKRQGSKVLLVNTTKFLGGMTCSGLSASDIFHREAVGVVLKDTIRA